MAKVKLNRRALGELAIWAAHGFLKSAPSYSTGDTQYVMFNNYLWLHGLSVPPYDLEKLEELAKFFRELLAFHEKKPSIYSAGTFVLRWMESRSAEQEG